MSRHASRFNKRDANEQIILHALELAGVEWYEAGPLDGWVFLGQWIPVEIKTPRGTLTDGQKAFIARCEIDGRPYRVWRNANEAVEAIQVYREGLR
jgi:hypothetical protein